MNLSKYLFFLTILMILSCQKDIEISNPNVLIILADDQGWGDLSTNGNPVVSTPNIDQLANLGTTLNNFYVNAVCSPTRAEMLTGRYHVRGGVYSTSQGGERLDLDEHTLAEAFQNANYRTGAFGKWHNGMQYPYHPNARGFDEFYGYCSGHWGSYFDAMLEHNGKIVQSKGYLTDVLTTKTIDFMSQKSNDPFLAYLPLNTPHSPMQVPDRWFDKFKNFDLPVHRYIKKEIPEKTKAAYAMAENIDWNVGRAIHALDSIGKLDNTIIIYFSDNGPNGNRWNNDMKGNKGKTDEGGLRSPFIIKWGDKIAGGNKIENIAHAIDLYPTLCNLANIPIIDSKPLDGISLAKLLLKKSAISSKRILYSYWSGQLSLRTERFRLDKDDQLFDIKNDRPQNNNVSKEFPEVFSRLVKAKMEWEREVLSELPDVDDRSFPIAHPEATITHLPARDAKVTGNIVRSNRWPNCSFYSNWKSEKDSIYWEADILSNGNFKPTIFYTCPKESVGHKIHLSVDAKILASQNVLESFDPPLRGMEHDRLERGESFVKDWKRLELPMVQLSKGNSRIVLSASDLKAFGAIDFRLMTLEAVQ